MPCFLFMFLVVTQFRMRLHLVSNSVCHSWNICQIWFRIPYNFNIYLWLFLLFLFLCCFILEQSGTDECAKWYIKRGKLFDWLDYAKVKTLLYVSALLPFHLSNWNVEIKSENSVYPEHTLNNLEDITEKGIFENHTTIK